MMYRTVTVTPRITKSVIRAEVGIVNPIVSVQAEYYTPVRSYDTIEYYDGAYEVNPDFVGTSLSTAGKVLTQNVNVHPIQVEDVSNPQGGRTVYIGGII